MNSPLMEKQFAIGNRKKLSNSLPKALKFKSSVFGFTLEQFLSLIMTANCFILTFSQVKSKENPTVSNICNVYCMYSEHKNFLNVVNSKYLKVPRGNVSTANGVTTVPAPCFKSLETYFL